MCFCFINALIGFAVALMHCINYLLTVMSLDLVNNVSSLFSVNLLIVIMSNEE